MLTLKWRHFKKDIILMAVRWYVAYSLISIAISFKLVKTNNQELTRQLDETKTELAAKTVENNQLEAALEEKQFALDNTTQELTDVQKERDDLIENKE